MGVGHTGGVRDRQGPPELAPGRASEGRKVRLKQDEHAAAAQTRSGERRGELARMMGVVVDDGDPPLLAEKLEAAADARETGEHGLSG